jgi:LacI family transcriptional regulator
MDEIKRRATVHDVAREAGVSLATVDRVLNGRTGVRTETAEKVAEAIKALGFRRDLSASLLARARDLGVTFLIPDGRNEFMFALGAAIQRRASAANGDRVSITTRLVHAFDPAALVAAIAALDPKTCDCAVIVATEEDKVRRAIDFAARRGIAVITLVSDLPGSARRHFVGIDNHAAGRTAASLIGRFAKPGPIGLIAGSLTLADHHQRREGFEAVFASEFPHHRIVGPLEGFDDDARTESAALELLEQPLAGIYNQAGKLRIVAHELTPATRAGLVDGSIDVVIDQNPDGEIAAALGAARNLALGQEPGPNPAPIEIGIYLRDNLPKG